MQIVPLVRFLENGREMLREIHQDDEEYLARFEHIFEVVDKSMEFVEAANGKFIIKPYRFDKDAH